MISRKEREELNALSKEVFGTSSRWQKLVDHGYPDVVTEEKEETVPAEKEGEEPTTKMVKVPVSVGKEAYKFTTKYHTVESIKEFMVAQKAHIDNIRAQIAKHQEEAKAAKEAEDKAKQVQGYASGSAT